ncbi:Ger(x)C family spore germination protein [Paenibacillus riograndensis]|uniref:Ger(X)C family germination protein n=1 Tax=Paenibacillus riograndensis SBR5 TaxID=1073571 RepID=A0A0E3WHH2_9BACL|nr:Ger(x)C family spore germination protein [Paenibacillus riograndensis]CQR55283.1 Ger(x)C family germination protein [Paenibacillus riograndensis SBR5]
MRRVLLRKGIVMLVMSLLLSGCWDTKDINKEYMPAVMGIGKGKTEKYRVILQVPNATGRTLFLEKEAKSITKAVNLIQTDAEKDISLVHLRLLLIDKELAEEGISNIVDFAVRANDISIKGMMAVVDGDFEKTLYHEISPTPEVSSYDFFSEEAGWTPNQSIIRIWEAYRSLNSYSEDMAIPMLKNGEHTLFVFKGTAVMKEDRMIGRLDQEETLLYNLFKGKYTGGTIELARNTSVLVENAKIKHHREWSKEGPSLTSDITLNVVIAESPKGVSNDQIEKEVWKQLDRKFNETLKKITGYHSDVLGVGLLYRPLLSETEITAWKSRWFPALKQQINVKVNVLNEIYFKNTDQDRNQGGLLKSR